MMDINSLDISSFDEEGFVVLKDIIPNSDLNEFEEKLTSFVSFKLKQEFGVVDTDLHSAFRFLLERSPETVSEIQRSVCRSPEYFRFASNKKLSNSINYLFNLESHDFLYMISNGIIFSSKEEILNNRSANMKLGWHNDVYFTIPRSPFIQIWSPLLQDATQKNGALKVIPKSHKLNILEQDFNADAPYLHRYTVSDKRLEKYHKISVEVSLGDVLIFDGRLIHASGTNLTNKIRCTMIGLLHNPKNKYFSPTVIDYKYKNQTPEEFYYENNKTGKIKEILKEQALVCAEPPGGV